MICIAEKIYQTHPKVDLNFATQTLAGFVWARLKRSTWAIALQGKISHAEERKPHSLRGSRRMGKDSDPSHARDFVCLWA